MSKVRVYELARDLKVESKDLITRAAEVGIDAPNHMAVLDLDEAARIRKLFQQPREGDVVETRVAKTVVRRRRRTVDEEPVRETPVVRRRVEEPEPEAAPEPVVEIAAEAFEAVEPLEAPAPDVAEAPALESAVAEVPATPEAPVEEIPRVEAPAAEPEVVADAAEVPAATEPEPEPAAEVSVKSEPRPSLLKIDPHGRPTERQAVVVAPPPPGFQAPRPPMSRGPAPGRPMGPGRGPGGPGRPGEARPGMAPDARTQPAGPAPDATRPRPWSPEDDRKGAAKKPKGKQVFDRRGGAFNLRTAVDLDDFGGRGGRRAKRYSKPKKAMKTQLTTPKAIKRVIKVEETITVQELAAAMSVKAADIIRQLMHLGAMATLNQALDFETAEMLANEAGFTVENVAFDLEQYAPEVEDTDEDLQSRPPVVTVMGHVDHGKTSLLDRVRKAHVADGEAGGITQHIGAYRVPVGNGEVVFLDTPGHEAFTAMRARGAQVTDIVILVVAADDGVMPQTIEAINHSREAGVPIIVAVNKIDKGNARPDRVMQELAEHGLQAEEWGGDTIVIKVSAHTGEGIDQLMEMLLLQSEVLDLKANPDKPARGVVIESQLDKGRGPVASVLVQEGTLRVGDTIVTGTSCGRVRALMDDKGNNVKEALPSVPVEVLGLDTVPVASDPFYVVEDDKRARAIVDHRIHAERQKQMGATSKVSLEDLFDQIKSGEVQELKIILKSDVHGSSEALKKALTDIKHDQVKVRIIHDGVGGISESDINLASASNAIIIGFNVRPEANAKLLAEQEHVDLKLYTVIYNAIDDVKKAMEGLLAPTLEEKSLGQAEVRNTFTVPKAGTVAGCYVTTGIVRRGALARLVRDSIEVWKGKIGSLRRFKDDVREVRSGFECGLGLENYNDVKVGDVIEAYEIIEVSQTLE